MKQPTWSEIPATGPSTVLNIWNGSPTQFLMPMEQGAVLWWVFDVADDEEHLALVVRLLDSEAQEVFETPWTVGRIETVRHRLAVTTAMIVKRGRQPQWSLFDIPRNGTEDEFLDRLFEAVDQTPMEPLAQETPVLEAATLAA